VRASVRPVLHAVRAVPVTVTVRGPRGRRVVREARAAGRGGAMRLRYGSCLLDVWVYPSKMYCITHFFKLK